MTTWARELDLDSVLGLSFVSGAFAGLRMRLSSFAMSAKPRFEVLVTGYGLIEGPRVDPGPEDRAGPGRGICYDLSARRRGPVDR